MAVQLTKEMIQGAQETERLTGVPSSITLAQIIEESSGSYDGGLSYLAFFGNNLFGVKSTNVTQERLFVRNSEGLKAWVKYDSQYDSIIDHARILQLDRYKSKYVNATSVSDYAQALQDGGYAGDSKTYASNLMSHVKTYNLNQYNLNNSTNINDTGVAIQGIGSGSKDTSINTVQTVSTASTDLNIFGNILKYLTILMLSIISIFFILKALKIEVL